MGSSETQVLESLRLRKRKRKINCVAKNIIIFALNLDESFRVS